MTNFVLLQKRRLTDYFGLCVVDLAAIDLQYTSGYSSIIHTHCFTKKADHMLFRALCGRPRRDGKLLIVYSFLSLMKI